MNIFRNLRKPNPTKAMQGDDTLLGYNLYADGRIQAIKQGSGMYGAGFGSGAFSETAFGTQIALSQSTFGWSAAYSVSTWVYRCIEVRKSAVHRMPWAVYSRRTKQIVPKHPLTIALKRNRQKIFKKLEQSQLLYGETFIEKGVNDYGYTSDLFWLNNNGMAVLQGAGHIRGYAYTAMQGGEPQTFDVDEVSFMKTDNPFNDLRGMSPTEVIMDDVAIDKDVARVVRAYYANDTRVGVIFIPKTNLLPSDQERFMEFFKRDNQGTNKAGKPVLMPQDMTVERIQEPATLDDVQLRESTRRAIAAGYGVPLSLAGGWDDAKYQSLPEQRKSFYEETIIPECDNIAEFINTELMGVFDDSGNSYFGYDYISILALTEDAQKKNDIYSNRLVSGLITRGEARQALGHPVRPQDDVYYIPVGATVIPANEQIFVTPNTDQVSDTTQEQQNEQPTTQGTPKPTQPSANNKPTNTPAANIPQPKQPPTPQPAPTKSIEPPQTTIEDELTAWEKKALNTNAVKAAGFVAYIVPRELAVDLRAKLMAAGKSADRATIKAIFAEARLSLKDFASDDQRKWFFANNPDFVAHGSTPDLKESGTSEEHRQQLEKFVETHNNRVVNHLWDTGAIEYSPQGQIVVNSEKTKQAAADMVKEARDATYQRDYLVRSFAASEGHTGDRLSLENKMNAAYANKARAIQLAATVGDVKLSEAQHRHLSDISQGKYLDNKYSQYASGDRGTLQGVQGTTSRGTSEFAQHMHEENARDFRVHVIQGKSAKAINPPKVTLDYWRHYDQLTSELGNIFIADYMAIAYSHLEPNINGAVTPDQVQSALDAYHNQFSQAWLGTEAAPGPLIKLIQAGMGAAQEALYHHSAANPHKPVTKDIGLAIDWNLLATEARQFAQTYVYSLIKGIDNTTIKFVQDAVAKWIESGQPLDALKAQLKQVFTDPNRADAIAETESTRAYFEGARDRYQKADVKKVKLSTLNDDLVCDVCLPLEGTIVLLSVGWKSSTGAAWPPFHTRCRHWIVPADDEED